MAIKQRQFTHVRLIDGGRDTRLRPIEPEKLRKGDYFKIHTDDPKDHLYGKDITFIAAADWDPKGEGPGGNIQVVIPAPPEGLVPDPDILK